MKFEDMSKIYQIKTAYLGSYGGGRGIRTPAPVSRPDGFQDRSLQPDLGIPPFWWTLQDSNLRPIGYEPIALTS